MTVSSLIRKGIDAASNDSLTEAEDCFRQAFLLAKHEGGVFNIGAANLIRLLYLQKKYHDVASLVDESSIMEILSLPNICILMVAESAFIVGHFSISLECYEYLHKIYPQEKPVLLGFSQAMLASGQLKKSRKVLIDYLNNQGPDAEVLTNLATLKLESGHINEAGLLYRNAVGLAPNQFITHFNLGKFLKMHGSLSEAIIEFDACLKLVPNGVEAAIEKAEILKDIGKVNESQQLINQSLEEKTLTSEQSISLTKPLIVTALEQKDFETCKIYLASLSVETLANYQIKSIIYDLPRSLQDEYGGGSHLYDPTQLVINKLLITETDLLQELADYVNNNESLIRDRPGKPTRGGSQTHEILDSQNEVVSKLREVLKKEMIAYASQMEESIKPSPNALYRISGWGVSLEAGGRQIRHTHPEAVVSGVIYLSIPKGLNSNDDKQGWLYFSSLDGESERSSLYVEPKEGSFVMFPSYIPHETVPFELDQKRICIAVNLVQYNSN
jgi:uncharacterized protein (TIGR02466 family)